MSERRSRSTPKIVGDDVSCRADKFRGDRLDITRYIEDRIVAVELRDLRWAIVAAQHRSLRQAAESLSILQSTLSRSLRDLEYQLGAVLFERTKGGTRVTVDGQEFLGAAKRIVGEADAIATRLRSRSRGERGSLTIGVQTSLATGNLRAALIQQHRLFPDVEMYLVDGASDHLISDLTSSAVDVAFVISGNHRWDGRSLSVWSERVVVALPANHRLSSQGTVHWSDLRDEKVLLPRRGPGPEFHHLLVSKLGYPVPCQLIGQDVSLDRFLSLVGAGWGVLLALEGATGVSYPAVTFREVHDSTGPTHLSFQAYWRPTNNNPVLRTFLDLLHDRYPDLSGAVAG